MQKYELTEWEKTVLKAYADNDMNLKVAAKQIYCHRNTAEYHVAKVKKRTGLDPKKFHDLKRLIDFIEKEEIDD